MKTVSVIFRAAVVAAMLVASVGWSTSSQTAEPPETITIGEQVWMKKNLQVDKFRNGDPITHARTGLEWEIAMINEEPAWCYYDNDPAHGEKYGKLYNWYAVSDPRGLAPEGWRIPTVDDWSVLMDALGGDSVAGKRMKSTDSWADHQGRSGSGTNESGFSGFPGGLRYGDGSFEDAGHVGFWWLYPDHPRDFPRYRILSKNADEATIGSGNRERGFSVRCLRE